MASTGTGKKKSSSKDREIQGVMETAAKQEASVSFKKVSSWSAQPIRTQWECVTNPFTSFNFTKEARNLFFFFCKAHICFHKTPLQLSSKEANTPASLR